jgi:hypothetical protein
MDDACRYLENEHFQNAIFSRCNYAIAFTGYNVIIISENSREQRVFPQQI